MTKDPGLGGPLGGLCNILFPKKYNKKYMYQSFYHRVGFQINPPYTIFYYYVRECSKEPIFIYRWNIYFCYIFAHIFLDHVPHMAQDTC